MSEAKIRKQLVEFMKGKSQSQAARELHISQPYLSEIIRGTRSVTSPPILEKFGYKKATLITKEKHKNEKAKK